MNPRITRRTFLKSASVAAVAVAAPRRPFAARSGASPELVLVQDGRARLPIVVATEAGEAAWEAARELAGYVWKITGVRPEVRGVDSVAPQQQAVWIGAHPLVSRAIPEVEVAFDHPEEILIACNGRNLVIAGRDTRFRGRQIEFGTANAVYTFIQKYLDVRWLWPGELGEDLLRRETLSLPPFKYRFHPKFLRRELFRLAGRQLENDAWNRRQRLKLDSLKGPGGGHAFTSWWERFHERHPEWFALQPDGTRGGYPSPRTVKMCLSNPEVAEQWIADALEAIENAPELSMLMAGENDSHSSGLCTCGPCRAMDHPSGTPWTYHWQGASEDYVAMSDRYLTFWNRLAKTLQDQFPDRDTLFVQGLAYGPSTPPPVGGTVEPNLIISYVGKFPTIDEETRRQHKAQWDAWSRIAPNMMYRPNLFYWTGGAWGLPDIAIRNVAEDFSFLAERRCAGIFVDTAQEHWATQGPQYYLMSQLAWNPDQDAEAVLEDYYRRGFAKAAPAIRAYWDLLESARGAVTASPGFGQHARHRFRLLEIFEEVYTAEFFAHAGSWIERATRLLGGQPETYRQRVLFVGAGLEFTRLMISNLSLMRRVRESVGRDREAVEAVARNWEAIETLSRQAGPVAINYPALMGKMRGTGYMGMMQDYFGPPAEKFLRPEAGAGAGLPPRERPDID